MSSLPTINDPTRYEKQLENNNDQAAKILQQLFPGIEVPHEYVGQILSYLATTRVNAQILPKVIRGIHNISIGTGKGQVIVHVTSQTVNVQVRESDEEIKTQI